MICGTLFDNKDSFILFRFVTKHFYIIIQPAINFVHFFWKCLTTHQFTTFRNFASFKQCNHLSSEIYSRIVKFGIV